MNEQTQKQRPSVRTSVTGLSRHDFKKRLGPGEAERFEIRGEYFSPGAGVDLSDDRSGDWTVGPKDVQVLSPSTILVERALHGQVPEETGRPEEEHNPLKGETPHPVQATLRVTVRSPGQTATVNSFTIQFTD